MTLAETKRPALGSLLPECPPALAHLLPRHMTLDSRCVDEGDVFIAMPGGENDGRYYIDAAFDRGACVVLAEADGYVGDVANDANIPLETVKNSTSRRVVPVWGLMSRVPDLAKLFYDDPSARMTVVAVTGTNGKTSVVDFIGQILRSLNVAIGCIGTLGTRLNNDVTDEVLNTTPDIMSINRQLAEWLNNGVEHVALEASSHALDQGRLTGLNLASAVFTNLSRDHLDYHGSELRYAEAKLRLFKDFHLKCAVFNADDSVARNVSAVANCPTWGISLEDSKATFFIELLNTRPLTTRLHTPLGTRTITANLSGEFNAFNLAAAVAVVVNLGYSFGDVVVAAEKVYSVPGRMERIANRCGISVVVDYAHTQDALARVLSALRSETTGQLWVVFGCGGDRDRGKRVFMGEEASKRADCIVVTSDNPRTENPVEIIEDVLASVLTEKCQSLEAIVDRAEAIRFALMQAKPGDTVLIAGKGHERYQEIAGRFQPFSDIDIASSCLAERVVAGGAIANATEVVGGVSEGDVQ